MSRTLAVTLFALLPMLTALSWQGTSTEAVPEPGHRIRLVLSGQLEGRLEPCGCASGQLGGLSRRVFHLQQERGNHDLKIEGGNLIAPGLLPASMLDEQKLDTALSVLDRAGYQVVCVGPEDLRLEVDALARTFAAFSGTVLASDLHSLGEAPEFTPKNHFDGTFGDTSVRVASLTLSLPEGADRHFALRPPAEAWKQAMDGVPAKTLKILFAHGPESKVRGFATLSPRPDLIVSISGAVSEPPPQATLAQDGVPLVFPGTRGRLLLNLTLARTTNASQVTRYQPVQLRDSETAPGAMDDRTTTEQILAHRQLVKDLELRDAMAEQLPIEGGATYVGSESCKTCHGKAYEVWKNSKHGHAWTTLEKAEAGELKMESGKARYGWPVTHYPDCVSCHVVGYGQVSGFVNPKKTPHLAHVGCEQCHGPGSAHMKLPVKETIQRGNAAGCVTCHDFEQSPDFDYAARWKVIAHEKW